MRRIRRLRRASPSASRSSRWPQSKSMRRRSPKSWTPKFVILGGWNPQTPRKQIARDLCAWRATLPQNERPLAQRPRYCAIAKLRPTGGQLTKVALELPKQLQEGAKREAHPRSRDGPPSGTAQKSGVQAQSPPGRGDGPILAPPGGRRTPPTARSARMQRAGNTSERAEAWAMVQEPTWEDFRTALEKAARE